MSLSGKSPSRSLSGIGRTAAVIALTALGVALAGCTSNPVAAPPVESTAPGTDVEPTPETTETTAPEPTGIPVGLTCDELMTPEQIYAFNPNFGADPGYAVASGSVAAEIVDAQGVSCGFLNQTSNDTIEVAVAHLDAAAIEARKNELVSSSNMVPTYSSFSDEGYFIQKDGSGMADVFVGEYWIHADAASVLFFEPGDAEQFLSSVASNIPA
ncbi:iron ABC transporter ATP-binding protein [Herbiconiux sp. L3-i23]|uniref:iron ABC transporter ATP-binding protein n=1 Tax=Herbiconiux sp. L3-i23 TaxID=2905871 RepID=UPI00205935DB|nr:iron ABC transporter ATP-binding protein [Herbiconiux sp. L3-i23]BDI21978.1 hypothetical protein L3i23_07540 [Herbiconiux sp. L3-i23]